MIRRTISELQRRYSLHPELKDIYVEGKSDKTILEWFLRRSDCEDTSVYEIANIEIPNQLMDSIGKHGSNRYRLIALALELEKLFKKHVKHLLCIADSDYDYLLGFIYESKYLVYTDYTSMDIYFFSEHVIEKIFHLGIQKVPRNAKEIMENISEVLKEVFLIRAASEKLRWKLNLPSFTRSCKVENNVICFDADGYINKCLKAAGKFRDKEKLINVCDKLAKKPIGVKKRVHGKDYLELLGWYVKKVKGKGGTRFANKDVIRGLVFSAVDWKMLEREKLFKIILQRYGKHAKKGNRQSSGNSS